MYGKATGSHGIGVCASGNEYNFFAEGPGEDYGSASSIRWKENVRCIDDPLGKVSHLRGVYFNWDADHGGSHDLGMIAEEVGKVLPEIVVYEKNGIDATGMDYSKLTPLLVEAVKALTKENEEMKVRLKKIETKTTNLTHQQQQIGALQAENDLLKQRLEILEKNITSKH